MSHSAAAALVLQHVAPEPPGRIADALDAHRVRSRRIRVFAGEAVPESMADAAGLVVMGGPMGVGDVDAYPHLRAERALIEDALRRDVPVLGICLGSQLVAHVLGAAVRPGPRMELGWHDVMLTDAAASDPLWRDVPDRFTAFHWHGDVFERPDGAVPLARSAQTDLQAFRYGDGVYGVLFHLEMTPAHVAGMTRAFPGEVAAAGEDGAVLRAAAEQHASALAPIADAVFGGWAAQVAARAA